MCQPESAEIVYDTESRCVKEAKAELALVNAAGAANRVRRDTKFFNKLNSHLETDVLPSTYGHLSVLKKYRHAINALLDITMSRDLPFFQIVSAQALDRATDAQPISIDDDGNDFDESDGEVEAFEDRVLKDDRVKYMPEYRDPQYGSSTQPDYEFNPEMTSFRDMIKPTPQEAAVLSVECSCAERAIIQTWRAASEKYILPPNKPSQENREAIVRCQVRVQLVCIKNDWWGRHRRARARLLP